MQFTAFEDPAVITATEFGFRREMINGAFQAVDISPRLEEDHTVEFLIAIDSKLMLGRLGPTGLTFPSSHAFREVERITSIHFTDDGQFAFVSCTGGAIYQVSVPSLRPVNKLVLDGTAVKSIIGVEGRKLVVHTFHDCIFEVYFSGGRPERSPHQLNLSPFKDPQFVDWIAIPGPGDCILATQLGSDCVSEWSWAQPSKPRQVYSLPEHVITHLDAQMGHIVMVLYK